MTALSAYGIGLTGFVKAREPSHAAALRALADGASPKVKQAIIDALRSGDDAQIAQLAEALAAGSIPRVMALLGLDVLEQRFAAVQAELRSVIAAAGKATAATIPARPRLVGPSLQVAFDTTNARTIETIQQYDLNLIREISENTRNGIRALITDGLSAGKNPRAVARLVKQQVGLTAKQQAWVGNFRRELETFHERSSASGWNLGGQKSKAPGGAGVMAIDDNGNPVDGIQNRRLRDFRFDGQLKRAMATGKPLTPEQIDKMVGRYQERLIAHRAETIARTEALRAVNAGNHLAWKQAIDTGAVVADEVRKFWHTAGDERVRLTHRRIPKMNEGGVGIDELFDTPKGGVLYPPLGPNCRCVVIYRVITKS